MIFLTVGTQKFQFNRLLEMVDSLIENGTIIEPVFAQIGYCTYIPKHFKYEQFLDKTVFEKCIDDCSILITHSGVGTILTAVNMHKPVIVVPRREDLQEHVDNHQYEIAQAFCEKHYVLMATDTAELTEALKAAPSFDMATYQSGNGEIVRQIENYIESL